MLDQIDLNESPQPEVLEKVLAAVKSAAARPWKMMVVPSLLNVACPFTSATAARASALLVSEVNPISSITSVPTTKSAEKP